jgi:septal ring factor EnvC (AmiA/AmiB activator)
MVGARSRKRDCPRAVAVSAALAAALLAARASPAAEQPAVAPAPAASPAPASPAPDPRLKLRQDRIRDLEAIERSLAQSDSERKRIEDEIAALKADGEKLRQDLVATAAKVQALEQSATEAEGELDRERVREEALKASLESRREMIGHVLAAMQRIGGKPPPAVIVNAQDILTAIRAATMLGAVLPQLREEARILSGDLAELVRLKASIKAQRETLATAMAKLKDERERLSTLIAERQARMAADQVALGEEGKRSTELGQKAKSLRDFLAGLDAEIAESERKEAEARRKAAELAAETRDKFDAASLKEPVRLGPKIAFADAQGLLPLPVAGTIARNFGDPDDVIGTARGISIVTRPGAVVSSPSEGVIAHAGPFRGYGQLLIINAGNGYHVVLAGMGRIDVAVGQSVLAGEPVGEMGDVNMLTTDGANATSSAPILYVEFRKDGSAINPGPWWAKTEQQKVRG